MFHVCYNIPMNLFSDRTHGKTRLLAIVGLIIIIISSLCVNAYAQGYSSPSSLPVDIEKYGTSVAALSEDDRENVIYIGDSFSLTDELPAQLSSPESLEYFSSDTGILRVNSRGRVTAVGGGQAWIVARTAQGKRFTLTINVAAKHTHFYQRDEKWQLPESVKRRLCLVSSYAMVINNLGISTDPEQLYNRLPNGGVSKDTIEDAYAVVHVPAIDKDSDYFSSYSAGRTYIKNSEESYVDAVKEALISNPEGVIVYFRKGSNAHAAVAIDIDADGQILYDDAGRTADKAHNVRFEDTWLGAEGYSYADLEYIAAIDRV